MQKLTIAEVEKRHPDIVKGQEWKGTREKYYFICKKHGIHLQEYNNHGIYGRACFKCGLIKSAKAHQTAKGLSSTPEYRTVVTHFKLILNPKHPQNKNYKGMPFFDEWNPKKGGSYLAGTEWVIGNLGKRPKGGSMHIVEHEKGFVPGNITWAYPREQSTQKMFKIITNLKHKIKELESELRIIKAKLNAQELA